MSINLIDSTLVFLTEIDTVKKEGTTSTGLQCIRTIKLSLNRKNT